VVVVSGQGRSLAAIMFTDIAGYTRMAQANEALALELLEEHRKVVRPLLSVHGGTEVKTIGDAFLVEFRSALEAVLCAADIQRQLEVRNAESPEQRRLRVRIGIHLGDVVHEAGDVYGDAVNVASRIEPLAEPGGICISQQVYDGIRNKTELEFEKTEEVELKNVELPVRVYRVNMSPRAVQGQGNEAPRERLAVLPFVNISPDPNDEYFADGLTEELISKLSEVKGLKVIARTSVMNYKKKEKSASQIGRELEAGSIIEGSVRKSGNRIRVTVQLIDSRTEEHVWASNYDKELDDIFAIQSDVASKVADSVSAGFFPKRSDTQDVEAYTLYIKGMQRLHEGEEKALREALELFERAIARDPEFARAYAGTAMAWARLGTSGYEEFGVSESRAEPAAKKALQLDPTCAEAHAAMSAVASILDRFEESRDEATAAVRINPNLANAHISLAIHYATKGKFEIAIASAERAHELDPLSVHDADTLARITRVAGKGERAFQVLQRMDELSPMNPRVQVAIAEYYLSKRDWARAQEFLDKAKAMGTDEPLYALNQGILYALTGRPKEAEEMISLMGTFRSEAVRLYGQLFIRAALGDLDKALGVLPKMAELHSWPYLVDYLEIFADLRKDSRYEEFAAKVGLRPQQKG
jgi:adenylate cyclase